MSAAPAPSVADQLSAFAATAVKDLPLYRRLALGAADDAEVAAVLDAAPPAQRLPVMLLAAVHDQVLLDPACELARWYPSVGGDPAADGDPVAAFRALVLERRDAVAATCASRTVQTNEVGRSAAWLPSWGLVGVEVGRPLGVVELGASAGLNLLCDRWRCDYEPGGLVGGDADGPVALRCELRGAVPPLHPVVVGSRVGVDLAPLDPADPAAARWLAACTWPEQLERIERLRAALAVAAASPPRLVAGDLVDALPGLLAGVDQAEHPLVVDSWALSYLDEGGRTAVLDALDAAGRARDLDWLAFEVPALVPELPCPPRPDGEPDRGATVLVRTAWRGGARRSTRLADAHPHGAWLRWW